MTATLLFVGDIHLGRRPAGLPEDLGAWSLSASDLTPAAAWRATVDLALRERVDAVVLAGDVVEADNARFEAFGPLEDGVRRLVEGGIDVFAVAGNHDVEALPRLAELIPGFRLLGRGGRWERAAVTRDGETLVHLLGWSFPARRHPSSPLGSEGPPQHPGDGRPLIGVLHCDLGGAGSPYAPVARADLERAGVDAWLLGHVHKPSDLGGVRPLGYLGSLVGLDPTETGPHGPWLARVTAGGGLSLEQVPLAPLRWEEVCLDLAAVGEPEELFPAVIEGLSALHRTIGSALGEARAVGCRIRLTGTTPFHRELQSVLDGAGPEALRRSHDGVLYFVEKVIDRSMPALDLDRIAAGDDPPALLARRLVELRAGGGSLLPQARRELSRVAGDPRWGYQEPVRLDDERIRQILLGAGMRALEELLRQASPGGPGKKGA